MISTKSNVLETWNKIPWRESHALINQFCWSVEDPTLCFTRRPVFSLHGCKRWDNAKNKTFPIDGAMPNAVRFGEKIFIFDSQQSTKIPSPCVIRNNFTCEPTHCRLSLWPLESSCTEWADTMFICKALRRCGRTVVSSLACRRTHPGKNIGCCSCWWAFHCTCWFVFSCDQYGNYLLF